MAVCGNCRTELVKGGPGLARKLGCARETAFAGHGFSLRPPGLLPPLLGRVCLDLHGNASRQCGTGRAPIWT